MTISVSAFDVYRTPEGRTIIPTDAWAYNAPTTDKGRPSVVLVNNYGNFPDDAIKRFYFPNPYTKSISGTVTEEGAPVRRAIRCYRRSDGHFVRSVYSAHGTGSYTISGLKDGEEYYLEFLDDETVSPDFNAITYDRVLPI